MKLMKNWKTALVVLGIFAFTMVFLPVLTSGALAADTAAPSDPGAEAGAAGEAAVEGAGAAGSAGGGAALAGLSAGTVAAGVVVLAGGIAIIAASNDGDSSSTSHH